MIQIRLYATLRTAAEGKTLNMDLHPPVTVLQVLRAASALKPKLHAEFWDENGGLRDYIKVFVNGRQSLYLPSGLETLLGAEDSLDVFPPVGGGVG